MMKEYSFALDQHQIKRFFSPVRNKADIIKILMHSVKLMLINQPGARKTSENAEIILIVSKMSRVFYFCDQKYFSLSFPFTVHEINDSLEFTLNNELDVDNKTTSEVLSIIHEKNSFLSNDAYDFIDPILDATKREPNFWSLMMKLLTLDDGYIRYEYDEERANGSIHPVNHYDIFYSSNTTFKLGLNNRINKEELIDLVKLESNCHYVSAHNN